MGSELACKRCGNTASMVRLVDDPGELAAVGRVLGMTGIADPYLLIDCPQCGIRPIEVPSGKNASKFASDDKGISHKEWAKRNAAEDEPYEGS